MSEQQTPYKIEGRESTIFRTVKNKDNPFVMIDHRPIGNPALSFKAKGILSYLLSRPDGWEVNVPDLVNHSTDGAAAIRSGLKELREARHIAYNPTRQGGYIKKWVIEVYEIPYDLPINEPETDQAEAALDDDFRNVGKSLDDDFLQVENLQVGNRGEVLKNLSNNESKKYKKQTIKRPDFKSLSPEKYRTIPELKTFMDATGWIPGSFVLEVVYDFVNKGLTREQINAAFSEWTSRGYKPANVKGYLTWARDGIPVERQYNQTPAQKTTNFDRTVAGLQKFMANHPEEAYGNS
jgi:hypothetical protein